MYSSYLKTAWRNFRKNKLFATINTLGLSLGIATCFVIMLYVQDELSYDRFHTNAGRIARVVFHANLNGGKIDESVSMPPVAATLKREMPEVEDATRLLDWGYPKIIYNNKTFKDDRLALADSNIFRVFTLPMVEGDASSALVQPHTLVMTQSTAEKYFGHEPAVGKTLVIVNDENRPYTVTGVIRDLPVNSHFNFGIYLSMSGFEESRSNSWMLGGYHTYALLKPGADLKKAEARFPFIVEKYMGPQIKQQMGLDLSEFRQKGNSLGFKFQPLTAIHLNSDTTTEFEAGGSKLYVYLFGSVAVIMLLIACINFINLSTAGAVNRAREVGVRKAIGSGRWELIKQFLSESTLTTCLALMIAFALALWALPAFNQLSGKKLLFGPIPAAELIGLGIIAGILAGIYPAFYMSSFNPITALKGKGTDVRRSGRFRSGLVVFQFFISVSLITGTIVVYQQMQFIANKDLGYHKEQLITLPNSWALGRNQTLYKQQLLSDPRIINATASWYKPAGPSNYNNALAYPKGNEQRIVGGVDFHVDEAYIPTMGMQLLSGRNFDPAMPTDTFGIILNETAVTALGWTNTSAPGQTIIRQNSDRGNNKPFHVIGVVKNFHFKSLHEAISPLYMSLNPEGGLIFKIQTTDMPGLLAAMKERWNSFQPEEPFTYNFMDDLYNNTYATEQKTGTVLNIFAVLTIFVGCLGLFGLATYTAENRTKEIGIRKVLGASVTQVTQMLSKEFVRLVLVASVIAIPVSWFVMNKWLQSFAYRISIAWWVFAVAGILALMIAVFTVCFQAIKAALANPARSLRAE